MFDVIGHTVKAFSQMRLGPWQSLGDTLLAGEGNLSFAKSLLSQPAAQITHMTATTYEKGKNLADGVRQNAALLQRCGAHILYMVLTPHDWSKV